MLLAEQALLEAALVAAATDLRQDIEAARTLGCLYWQRSQAQPGGIGQDDLDAAVELFTPVFRADPAMVPAELRGACQRDGTALEGNVDPAVWDERAVDLVIAYESTGDLSSLIKAMMMFRAALQATSADDPQLSMRLSNLGLALLTLFEQTGQRPVLSEAIQVARRAAAITASDHPYRPAVLSNLGYELRLLFEQTGQQAALEEAVQVGRDAVAATPADHPNRVMSVTNLGLALQTLFERTGQLTVLEEAVAVGRDAVAAAPDDYRDRAGVLSNLALVLRLLFDRTGQQSALEEAVRLARQAVTATPDDHLDHAMYLANLGLMLQTLFKRTGRQAALEEAVQADRDAIAATLDGHPNRALYLSNLGIALLLLFDWTGQRAALEEAVQTCRDAVAATPNDHPSRPARLSNLALVLRDLAERTGRQALLEEAIQTDHDAVAATPNDHPNRAMYLSNLGLALRDLAERTGRQVVLEEAIQAGRDAVAATPADDPNRAIHLSNLARALQDLYERTGNPASGGEARDFFRQAAAQHSGPARTRIRAYRAHAALSNLADDPATAALADLEAAVRLLPQAVPRHQLRSDREHELAQLAGIAAQAGAAAVTAGLPDRAVELLEATRGILVADTLEARSSDLATLHSRAPAEAASFSDMRDRIEALDRQPSSQPSDLGSSTLGPVDLVSAARQAAQTLTVARRQAQQDWDALLERIRNLDDFSSFLQPADIRQIAAPVTAGPVVFLYTHSTRSDALILSGPGTPVRAVALGELDVDDVGRQAARLRRATATATSDDARLSERTTANQDIHEVLAWMWDTIAEPVLADLGHTATPAAGQDWPRVWWCPVGILAQLPLHAAGHHPRTLAGYAANRDLPTVLDRVISSYTTTARSLAYARTSNPPGTNPSTVIIVEPGDITRHRRAAGPPLPGSDIPPLPGAAAEAQDLAVLIPDAHILTRPARDDVLAALPRHAVAHLACHGLTDWNDPGASQLILRDHHTHPLTLAQITALHLDHARLAYLSACDTTGTTAALADEAVHITAAFQLAGYQHVVGTLWPIIDDVARAVAHDIYTQLTNRGHSTPDTDGTAQALHHATRRMRATYPAVPALWAPYLHTGT